MEIGMFLAASLLLASSNVVPCNSNIMSMEAHAGFVMYAGRLNVPARIDTSFWEYAFERSSVSSQMPEAHQYMTTVPVSRAFAFGSKANTEARHSKNQRGKREDARIREGKAIFRTR